MARIGVACVGVSSILHEATMAQGRGWTVRAGDVRVACPLTIGGSFDARTRMVSGSLQVSASTTDPLAGEIIVELGELDTGIGLRNQHLRDNYLEVGKGPEFARAVLSHVRMNGLNAAAPEGKGTFSGTLRLHGAERPVAGQVEVRKAGAGLRVRASFPVSIKDFGIAEPRYLGVGVKDQVTVQVNLELISSETTR